jgi:hypothetical protein
MPTNEMLDTYIYRDKSFVNRFWINLENIYLYLFYFILFFCIRADGGFGSAFTLQIYCAVDLPFHILHANAIVPQVTDALRAIILVLVLVLVRPQTTMPDVNWNFRRMFSKLK